jgi:hypothetical protein
MSNRFHGKQFKGAGKMDRKAKRREAAARNELTPEFSRKACRKGTTVVNIPLAG